MRWVSFFILFTVWLSGLSQYNDPYRLAYDGSNYYVTNNGNGTITKVTSTGKTSTVITGLNKPTDILFASVLGNTALAVIDDNKLKLYDTATFKGILSITITGALEAHDGVFNPKNTNEFFITDRKANSILKGTIGSPPLYPISFSTLASGITKPTGIILNDKDKLLVVTDSANAKVIEVDPVTGAKTTKLSTTYNQFNDITQDAQKNYYVTCWGDDNMYRYDANFKNEKRVNTFNDPSGLFTNTTDNLLGVCCTNCQKLEFFFFHLFTPLADIETCKEAEVYTDFLPSYKGIGTYNSNNVFLVEMSDSNGLFNFPKVIGRDTTTTRPKSIIAKVPSSAYDNVTYKYRFRSTSPQTISYFSKDLKILNHPEAFISNLDSIQTCQDGILKVGMASEPHTIYNWSPSILVDDSTNSNPTLKSDSSGYFDLVLNTVDTSTTCASQSSIRYSVKSKLELVLDDTISGCKGDTLALSLANIPYIYNWTGSDYTIDTVSSNLLFFGSESAELYITYSDSQQTCFGNDSLYAKINALPRLRSVPETITFCEGDTIILLGSRDGSKTYWYNNDALDLALTPIKFQFGQYLADSVGYFDLLHGVTDLSTNCSNSILSDIKILNTPDSMTLYYDASSEALAATIYDQLHTGIVEWFVNGTKVLEGDLLSRSTISEYDTIWARYTSFNECSITSDSIIWSTVGIPKFVNDTKIYPNPANNRLFLTGLDFPSEVSIYSSSGQLIKLKKNEATHLLIELGSLSPGVYTIKVKTDAIEVTSRFVKL